jgi:DNA-binding HxlR family transcriptional regulator
MKSEPEIVCHVEAAIAVIGGKWKPWILWRLYDGARRFGELQRITPGITHKMLAQHLRELERDGVIRRKVYEQKPAKVEYSFTPYGETLRPILKLLCDWGALHLEFVASNGKRAGRKTAKPAGKQASKFSNTKAR